MDRLLVFAFYNRLSPARRRIYDRSDALSPPRLPAGRFKPLAAELMTSLTSAKPRAVTAAAQAVADTFVAELKLPAVRIIVRRTRPERGGAEYHGYYEGADHGSPAQITLWMYTARRQQVVAFRTFLRTLVHELCHHLDFEGLRLAESFHTEGFYARESGLFRDVVGEAVGARPQGHRA